MDLHGTGRIMCNRTEGSKLSADNEFNQGNIKEVCRSDGRIIIVKWKDNICVILASTCSGAEPVENVQRWSKHEKRYVVVRAPAIVRRYNASMGGVDIVCDQPIE